MSHLRGDSRCIADLMHHGMLEDDIRRRLCLLLFPRRWWFSRRSQASEGEDAIGKQKRDLDYWPVECAGVDRHEEHRDETRVGGDLDLL